MPEKQLVSVNSNLVMAKFLNDRIFETYFQLRDWNGYLAWMENYRETAFVKKLIDSSDSLKQQIESQIDVNYIK